MLDNGPIIYHNGFVKQIQEGCMVGITKSSTRKPETNSKHSFFNSVFHNFLNVFSIHLTNSSRNTKGVDKVSAKTKDNFYALAPNLSIAHFKDFTRRVFHLALTLKLSHPTRSGNTKNKQTAEHHPLPQTVFDGQEKSPEFGRGVQRLAGTIIRRPIKPMFFFPVNQ